MDSDVDISQSKPSIASANELVYERKFDVALRDTQTHAPYIIDKINNLDVDTYEYVILRKHLSSINIQTNELKYNSNIYPTILTYVLNLSANDQKLGIERILNIIQTSVSIQFAIKECL